MAVQAVEAEQAEQEVFSFQAEAAVLTLGARIEDPTTFVQRLNSLLVTLTEEEPTESTDVTGNVADGRLPFPVPAGRVSGAHVRR